MRLLQAHGFKLTFIPENLAHFGNYTTDFKNGGAKPAEARSEAVRFDSPARHP